VRSLVSSLIKSKANADEWTATLEFKAILAMLVRSLELCDTDAVVQQKNAPAFQPVADGQMGLSSLSVTLVWGSTFMLLFEVLKCNGFRSYLLFDP